MYEKIETETKKVYVVNGADQKKDCVVAKLLPDFFKVTGVERQKEVRLFVKRKAKDGWLDSLLTLDELDEAIHQGILPPRFNVHHYVPISFGGNNHVDNLCIIDKELHKILHAHLLDPIYRDFRLDSATKKVYLILPKREPVLTLNDGLKFFSKQELEKAMSDNETVPASKLEKAHHIDARDMVFSLRLMDELSRGRVFVGPSAGQEETVFQSVRRMVRQKNTDHKRKKEKMRGFWNERREGKVGERMGRKEKAELKAKKAKRVATRQWYGNFIAMHYVFKNRRQNS